MKVVYNHNRLYSCSSKVRGKKLLYNTKEFGYWDF